MGKKSFMFCKALIVAMFAIILLTMLVILSIQVHDELPTISTEYTQIDEFASPVISIQLKSKFEISCTFLLFDFYGKKYIYIQ
jgi:hypothetical protein